MADDHDPNVLAGLPIRGWLADCSLQFRREFLALARPKSFPAGSVIYRVGDVGHDLFGIRSGVVLVQCRFTHPDAVLLHMLRPGEWFGTLDWLAERSRRFSTVARTDVELLRVPGDEMHALLRRRPEGVAKLGRNAVYGLDLAMQCAADLLIRDTSARCAAGLLRLAGRRWASGPEADLPTEIPASQTELAMLCNVSRNTFSRVVKEFASRRLVTLGYRSLTVNDPARLRAIAEAG
jgi:CRP/FNR family cyclic AMP-dependent transcriptional regulator